MEFQRFSSNDRVIRGIIFSSDQKGKVFFLGTAPSKAFPQLQNFDLSAETDEGARLCNHLASHFSKIHSDLDRLQTEYDWDEYMVKILKRLRIQAKIIEGKLNKFFQNKIP